MRRPTVLLTALILMVCEGLAAHTVFAASPGAHHQKKTPQYAPLALRTPSGSMAREPNTRRSSRYTPTIPANKSPREGVQSFQAVLEELRPPAGML